MSSSDVVNALAYRLKEMYDYMRHTNPQERLESTVWEDFVRNWQGEEARDWFDEDHHPIPEWDGIWHAPKRSRYVPRSSVPD